jgi:hypothetical protein
MDNKSKSPTNEISLDSSGKDLNSDTFPHDNEHVKSL